VATSELCLTNATPLGLFVTRASKSFAGKSVAVKQQSKAVPIQLCGVTKISYKKECVT